jgi:hypothetical protein
MKRKQQLFELSIRQVVRRYQAPSLQQEKLKWLKSLLERIF